MNTLTKLTSLAFSLPFKTHLYLSYFLRLCLIAYGDYQDSNFLVKFTDVDYKVFTDAARHVSLGQSPYERHTYRYTPLLAWMLHPNISVHPLFGKALFCAFDVIAGKLIYSFVKDDHGESRARISAFLWLYNPMVFVVSARGNAEAVIVTLVLVTLHLFREGVFVLAGIAFGLSVHFKIYPIIYSVSFFLALSDKEGLLRRLFDVNAARGRFVIGTVATLASLTAVGYFSYGQAFLDETYLYHVTRRDVRHNFSPYFYMLYLTSEDDDVGINLLTFLPQAALLLAAAFKFGRCRDLPFCLFCQTVVFVAYNKVVTSQYFLWYLSLLPLCLPKMELSVGKGMVYLLVWSLAQGFWLLPAYCLEFRGDNTFLVLWIEGLAFFMANIGLLACFVRKYREGQQAEIDMSKVD